jgi:hypothetical protein
MNLGTEIILRLNRIDPDGEDWEIRSRARLAVYVMVFIPKTAGREERNQRFAYGIGDAIERCARADSDVGIFGANAARGE